MTPEEFERERRLSAEAIRKASERAEGPNIVRTPEEVLGPAPAPKGPSDRASGGPEPPPAWNPPPPPDLGAVNASWSAEGGKAQGRLAGLVGGTSDRSREAQVRFNSDQVQLDNALVTWTAEHFAATHRHYDAIIASMHKRMDEIDTRHRELEKELVRHVHEMAQRIDVVLGEGEKGRVAHEAACWKRSWGEPARPHLRCSGAIHQRGCGDARLLASP
jgi:hypothetical protein